VVWSEVILHRRLFTRNSLSYLNHFWRPCASKQQGKLRTEQRTLCLVPSLLSKKALKVLRALAGQKTSFLQQVKEYIQRQFFKNYYQKRSRTKIIKNSAKFMKNFEVYLRQDQETRELKVELKIFEEATIEDVDEIWELVERARLLMKQIKNYGLKITETQE